MTVAGAATILTVNAGSSSVRLALFSSDGTKLTLLRAVHAAVERDPQSMLRSFVDGTSVDVVAHRVVHGGPRLGATCTLDDNVVQEIRRMRLLAPLHNAAALAWAAASKEVIPAAVELAVFDHGFFTELPPVANTYPLPVELRERWGLRRLGFHGLAHRSMWETFRRFSSESSARVISFQLGSGCSAAALRDGQPIDTSMGFTPIEGLVMGTRSGDMDPGLILFLLREVGISLDALDRMLNHECGLAGLSGGESDVRVLLTSDRPEAELALAVYAYRIRKCLGGYMAALGGCDAVLIGGGVGENAPSVRKSVFLGLDALGIELDELANQDARPPARISRITSRTQVWVVATDEQTLLAREALSWLHRSDGRRVLSAGESKP